MTCDVTTDTKWCKITIWNIYANTKSTGLKFCRVDATTTQFDSGYDVTKATNYSLLDLYLPKMKTALFVVQEFNIHSCACAV